MRAPREREAGLGEGIAWVAGGEFGDPPKDGAEAGGPGWHLRPGKCLGVNLRFGFGTGAGRVNLFPEHLFHHLTD